jgi:hypothetical protein
MIPRTPSCFFSRDGWVFEFKYDESPDLEGVTSQVLKSFAHGSGAISVIEINAVFP